ncbi:MAG: hypothetical protein R3F62_12400 [Planctomycetota bacterium]
MAVSSYRRRRLVVAGRAFYWSIAPDPRWYYDAFAREDDVWLRVVPDDKRFRLAWAVDAARRRPGELHPLVTRADFTRFTLVRRDPPPPQVTPSFVAELVRDALALVDDA